MEILFALLIVVSLVALIVSLIVDVIKNRSTRVVSKKSWIFLSIFSFSTLSFIVLFSAENPTYTISIFWLIFVVITLYIFKLDRKLKNRMNELGAKEYLNAVHADGLPISKGIQTNLFCCDDKLVIESKEGSFEIPIDRINNYARITAREILEQEKSVIGRAVVGGLLLGGLGAVVGGISGVGSKKKNINKVYFVINYVNKDEETEALSFETNHNVNQFVKRFSEATGKPIFDNEKFIAL